VSVVLCDDARIAEVNKHYRGVNEATDVLTFSQNEGDRVPGSRETAVSGDIMISLETVASNAEQYGVEPRTEFTRVLAHGILHLAGYAHDGVTLADAAAASHPMLALQEEIVATLEKEQDE
jgi:probable rRNA maturation factor